MTVRVLPYGDRALLVEIDDPVGLARAMAAQRGVEEVVPAARTVLVRFDPAVVTAASTAETIRRVADARPGEATALPGSPSEPLAVGDGDLELAVRYDGADLALVAATAGCEVGEVIRRHCHPTYTVAFCGFAPGFAYLTGLHPSLQQPRLDQPRANVPAGSVGLAGEFTGIYPRASPGGWRLLGRTDATLWDVDRDPPALLTPGLRVRLRPA